MELKVDRIDSDDEVIDSLKLFCGVVDIPYNTFKKYVGENENKRRKIGSAVGCRTLLLSGDQSFVAEICARQDIGNDGLERCDVFEYIRELKPCIYKKQANNHYNRTLKKNNSTIVKAKLVAAQATTTQQNSITVVQQYCWHKFVDSAINFLRSKNKGLCKCGNSKTFGELIDHFIIGGDETFVMASKQGVVRIVDAAFRKKHESKRQDCRDSITMFRTGNAAGDTGPAVFLT